MWASYTYKSITMTWSELIKITFIINIIEMQQKIIDE